MSSIQAQFHTGDFDDTIPTSSRCTSFTAASDPRWSGMQTLMPHAALDATDAARQDIFIVDGALADAQTTHLAGTFIGGGASDSARLHAGPRGAVLFIYRDFLASARDRELVTPAQRVWMPGGAAGMHVAQLSARQHRLMLVRWQPGTRMGFHRHPHGEEILVLGGCLQDGRGSYTTGSWQRLHADEGHAPFAGETTLILLRNGHLRPAIKG